MTQDELNDRLEEKRRLIRKKIAFEEKFNLGTKLESSKQYCRACGSKLNKKQIEALKTKTSTAFNEYLQETQQKKKERKKKIKDKIEKSNLRVLRDHFLLDYHIPVKGDEEDKANARRVNRQHSERFAKTALERIETKRDRKKLTRKYKATPQDSLLKKSEVDKMLQAIKKDSETQKPAKEKLSNLKKGSRQAKTNIRNAREKKARKG